MEPSKRGPAACFAHDRPDMRSIGELPSVLYDLARHPDLGELLFDSKRFEAYLKTDAWPEQMDDWAALDSQMAAEMAEMTPEVERWLATLSAFSLNLLAEALEDLVPGSVELLRSMLPPGTCLLKGDFDPWTDGLPEPRFFADSELPGNKDKGLALYGVPGLTPATARAFLLERHINEPPSDFMQTPDAPTP